MTGLLTSASQIKLYRECKRKFGWSYLAKIKSPPNAGMLLGIDVDDNQLQPYLREGKPFDYSKDSGHIAAAGLAYLPQPMSPGLQVQKHFVFPSPSWEIAEFSYQGYEDLYLPDSKAMPECEGGVPCVGDFKTTRSFSYALTKVTLAKDVQAMLYAMHTLYETGAPAVDLVWLYLLTQGARKVRRVHLRVTSDHVAEQFADIDKTAVEMFEVRKAFAASGLDAEAFTKTLDPTVTMCREYGGCPYQSKCNLSPTEKVNALGARLRPLTTEEPMTTSTFDLLANLKQRTEPVSNGVGTPHPEVKAVEVKTQAKIDDFVKSTEALPEWATTPVVALGINPPESALPPAPIALKELSVAVVAEPKRRGRPAGAKNTKPVEPYEAAIQALVDVDGFSSSELRTDAYVEFTRTIGQAFLKLSGALEVSK